MADGFELSDGVTREQGRYRFNVKITSRLGDSYAATTAAACDPRSLGYAAARAVRSPSARSPAIADTYVHRRAPSCRPLCNAFIDHHRPVDAVRVSEGKPPMENAKHIGCMWALAVALGVGMAVANTPAVALAAPADSGTGSSSGGSSPSSSSRHSGSTSSDTPSAKSALSATNDAPGRHRRPLNPPGETAVSSSGGPQTSTTTGSSGSAATTAALTPSTSTSSKRRAGTRATSETPGTDARQRGGATSHPGSGATPVKTGPNPAVDNAAAADPTARDSSLDFTRRVVAGVSSFASTTPSAKATPVAALTAAPMSSTAAAPAIAPPSPASMVITPTPADPVSRFVSTLFKAVLSPIANSAPSAPAQAPGAWTMLAFARREFGQAFSTPSTTVNPLAGHITNGLVTDTVGNTSKAASTAVDPGFISSTMNFGRFSITSAADPDDNDFVAVVFSTPLFTDILTSGADPEDNLGFGATSIGIPGQTVNTFLSPILNFTIAIPVTGSLRQTVYRVDSIRHRLMSVTANGKFTRR